MSVEKWFFCEGREAGNQDPEKYKRPSTVNVILCCYNKL